MKKLLNTAFFYAMAALAGGVFYREFTKLNGFAGKTSLVFVHTHLFVLGMFLFLLLALFCAQFPITESKKFKPFYLLYNAGMALTAATFIWRGILQVLGGALSRAVDASISGVAGIGHTLLGVGLVLLFLLLKEQALVKTKGTAHRA